MTEQQLQKKITTMLEKDYDAYVVKVQVASKAGVPDLLCCIQGRFVGIEVKLPRSRNNVSKLQEWNLRQIELRDGLQLVAWDIDYLKEYLNEFL